MPDQRSFLTAEWRDLVIVNYEVAPALLEPLVPRGTTLDLWNGQALVSLVGFRFVDTRVLGVGVPMHRDFEEVNLRFYVRHAHSGEDRRGVAFIRELVPRAAIAFVARAWYNEPYRALPMRHHNATGVLASSFGYEWRESREWCGVEAVVQGHAADLVPGSKAEFITEHFWGYTRQRDGGTIEYRVAHPRWRVWESAAVKVTGDLRLTYGERFGALLAGAPDSAYVAVGSPVTVYQPRRV
jgi:uncharacterized protein YqjF (DUF2071 family)